MTNTNSVNRVRVFDTTLRDGEQSPGMSMNLKEKIEMAKQLERLGVDIVEAGFAISSPGDFESVKAISETLKDCTVCSLARANAEDIERAWEAVCGAVDPRLHIFIATSDLHMQYKLKMSREEVLAQTAAMTKKSAAYTRNVQFSAEDATRSDRVFLAEVIRTAIQAGATTINLPDTVGYATPEEYYEFIRDVRERVPETEDIILSAHNHNDLGLGVATSLAGVRAGVRQVECTINGIGERAGNAALEEIVMTLGVRKGLYQVETGIVTTEIIRSSKLLSRITGVKVQPNKAIVGANAFAHEAGIHQHGVLTNPLTYEIMTPESVGLTENNLVLGKHSGRHAFSDRVKSLGYELNDSELNVAFEKFKLLADKKKRVFDRDIEAIIAKESVQVPKTFTLNSFVINSGNTITATAVVKLNYEGKIIEKVARGDGPIDAAFNAINKIVGKDLSLEDYALNSVTEGLDALGDARVMISEKGSASFSGRGLSTDVVEASINAYINAVNKIYYSKGTDEV